MTQDSRNPPNAASLSVQDSPFGAGVVLNLPVFEGPMDLLLYLIRREEVDIFDIPIALITRQYLHTLEIMRAQDLDVGGEFLVMAATLLAIKARMLLPRPSGEDAADNEDPRSDLVERILEYRAFKESAQVFRSWELAWSQRFLRGSPAVQVESAAPAALQDVTLFDLLVAFKLAMDRLRAEKLHYDVFLPPEKLDQRIAYLRTRLQEQGKISFSSLVRGLSTRLAIILTFLAILELVRTGEIALKGVKNNDFLLIAKQA